MFNFFANLALTIYHGSWQTLSNTTLIQTFVNYLKVVPIFGLFNNSTEAFYNTTIQPTDTFVTLCPPLAVTISVILSTICCISVFFIIVNAIRKMFTCFLEWL